METIRIIKCDNPVYADAIIQRLVDNNIAALSHDETLDPAVGSYGGTTGIAIRVYEKDEVRAREIVDQMEAERKVDVTWCPKCESTDLEFHEVKPKPFSWIRTIFGSILVIYGLTSYVSMFFNLDLISSSMSATLQFILATIFMYQGVDMLLSMVTSWPARDYYECKKCGKTFPKR